MNASKPVNEKQLLNLVIFPTATRLPIPLRVEFIYVLRNQCGENDVFAILRSWSRIVYCWDQSEIVHIKGGCYILCMHVWHIAYKALVYSSVIDDLIITM
ncbi:hypothetical protein NP493_999g01028 [Ridgeia piscesae]|uniref:Uncharacterized protein n=1 Tax=Ridgeia piscesae TaxID=27915 RepID=A0AAD9NJ71_RIDPI|nr:hypothetical protein NP493_999g01028 [Ridgeia piscesae]